VAERRQLPEGAFGQPSLLSLIVRCALAIRHRLEEAAGLLD
jgi:hypothetical protein